jgi:hypothetical protein
MSILKKVMSAILLVSLLAVAGCPQVGDFAGAGGQNRSNGFQEGE